jgi:predicted lipid-binding transport protein (Tim44 family)
MIRRVVVWGWVPAAPAAGLASEAMSPSSGVASTSWWVLAVLAVTVALLGGALVRRRAGGRRLRVGTATHSGNSQFDPALPRQYSPQNVGNDASARPWESVAAVERALGAAQNLNGPPVPEGFDTEAFLRDSKSHFVGLQAAWDRGDVPALRAMMTAPMLAEIQGQLAERERQGDAAASRSEVVMIDAQLLGVEEVEGGYVASVEFSGLVREGNDAGPNPFRELWSITRPKGGDGRWLVAGVQALH